MLNMVDWVRTAEGKLSKHGVVRREDEGNVQKRDADQVSGCYLICGTGKNLSGLVQRGQPSADSPAHGEPGCTRPSRGCSADTTPH